MNMSIEKLFAKHLIINKNMIACDEVSHYGHRADVLAVDRNKELIFEYEFKRSSNDLKVAEYKKEKYYEQKRRYKDKSGFYTGDGKYHYGHLVRKMPCIPHYFYFVVPKELYEKEKKYLRELKCGVMTWEKRQNLKYACHIEDLQFYIVKRITARKSNLQKYPIALRNIAKRLSNVFAWGGNNEEI